MNTEDKKTFLQLITDCLDVYGRKPSAGVIAIWWGALAGYDFPDVRRALSAVMSDPDAGRFPPTPAAVIAEMASNDGHPEADEAWAICLESFDECATVCATTEILEARTAAARVFDAGDIVGARMAFRSAYDRIVTISRRQCAPPRWALSLGHDADQRATAAQRAFEAGRITGEAARKYLPAPKAEGPAAIVAGLLSGKVVELPQTPDAVARQRIRELRDAISTR